MLKKRNKKVKLIVMFSLITLICIIAIYEAIYTQFYKKEVEKVSTDETEGTQAYQEIKLEKEFNDIFDNRLNVEDTEGIDLENIEKQYSDKELVYTDYYKKDETDSFEIDVTIPKINIKEAESINNKINSTFIQKAESVQHNKQETKTIYDIKYTSTINGKILSIIVDSRLREKNGEAQKEIIKTYNFNLETKQEIKLNDIINEKNIKKEDLQNKIKETIRKKIDDSEAFESIGFEVYKRDLRSDIYDIENIENFYYGKNKVLYIIFAYGNNAATIERDIVTWGRRIVEKENLQNCLAG